MPGIQDYLQFSHTVYKPWRRNGMNFVDLDSAVAHYNQRLEVRLQLFEDKALKLC